MEGLDKFREAFKDFSDNYVIIGGTACDITMAGTEVRPRATHDIDMIIVVERMTPQYGERFWQFIREAGYRPEKSKTKKGESPKYEMYRFVDGNSGYPEIRHADSAALVALKARAYLNLIQDKYNGIHVNTKDIKKHRSDILKNVVIMKEDEIQAPSSIVECIKEFVLSIRSNWEELAIPLAKSLDQNTEFVNALLEQLENLFVIRS